MVAIPSFGGELLEKQILRKCTETQEDFKTIFWRASTFDYGLLLFFNKYIRYHKNVTEFKKEAIKEHYWKSDKENKCQVQLIDLNIPIEVANEKFIHSGIRTIGYFVDKKDYKSYKVYGIDNEGYPLVDKDDKIIIFPLVH